MAAWWLLPLWAQAEWLKLSSDHFVLYTTAGERTGRENLQIFERARAVFTHALGIPLPQEEPVRLIGVRNVEELRPYAVSMNLRAFYVGHDLGDYIVFRGQGEEIRPVAVHEYVHLLLRRVRLHLPLWLEEGLAELFATVELNGGRLVLGSPPAGRAEELRRQRWLPLRRLLQVQRDWPEYDGSRHSGSFYAQSWLLTHMLYLSPSYRSGFPALVEALAGRRAAAEAFQEALGKSVEEVGADLERYARQSRWTRVTLAIESGAGDRQISVQRAEDTEWGLIQAELFLILGKREAAGEALQKLLENHPSDWRLAEAVAQTAWRHGQLEMARQFFEVAAQRNPDEAGFHERYARLLAIRGEDEKRIASLLPRADRPGTQSGSVAAAATVKAGKPALEAVTGLFEYLDCLGQAARMHVRVGDRLMLFWIPEPAAVRVRDSSGAPVTLACGEQKPKRTVKLGSVAQPDTDLNTLGIVKELEFFSAADRAP